LAEREEREIEKLVYEVIEAQLQKLEIKMKCFDELEDVLKEEQLKVDKISFQYFVRFSFHFFM
jgi:SWI/SNF related-matrix-associated actin-dependent regulator of chromatin subfamily C